MMANPELRKRNCRSKGEDMTESKEEQDRNKQGILMIELSETIKKVNSIMMELSKWDSGPQIIMQQKGVNGPLVVYGRLV